MLGKLLKNEWKCTYKQMLVLYVILIVVTVFGCLECSIDALQKGTVGQVLARIFVLTYAVSVITLMLMTYINMVTRFFKSMYSEQGYLTHTLPVKPLSHLNVKLFVSFVWLIVSGILLILSVAAICIADGFSLPWPIDFNELNEAAYWAFGYNFVVTVLVLLLVVFFACLDSLLLAFAALSLGQLSNQHKVGSAVGWGIGLYFVQQATFVAVLVTFYQSKVDRLYDRLYYVDVEGIYPSFEKLQEVMIIQARWSVWLAIGLFAAFAVIQYAVNAIIIKKHVNLQ